MKLYPYLISYTKVKSKYFKHLRVRPEIMKSLKESTGNKLLDIGIGNDF